MIELNEITFWPDVEIKHLKTGDRKEDRLLLLYRILQQLNLKYANRSGIIKLSWVVENVAGLLDVSEETIRRCCKHGDGKWWRLTAQGYLVLTGWRKINELYGVQGSSELVRIRVKFLQGSILNFRKVLYAMLINSLCTQGEQFIALDRLASMCGVSKDTIRRLEKDNPWIQVAPTVEILDKLSVGPVTFGAPPKPAGMGASVRIWRDAKDHGELRVRQHGNARRSRLAGYGDKPLAVGESHVESLHGGGGSLMVSPLSFYKPKGAVVWTEPRMTILSGRCVGTFVGACINGF